MLMLGFAAAAFGLRGASKTPDVPAPALDLPAPAENETSRTAVFAGGCFWCTEGVCERVEGVTDVVSGYAGGTKESATYEQVGSGNTAHAEAIKITYDPKRITYGQLLRIFFTSIDPTTKDAQGPDHGTQYRSAIFYENDDQKRVVEAYLKQLSDAKIWSRPIVTTVEPIGAGFFAAEDYHHDFAKKHPNHPYIRAWFDEKLQKVKEKLGDDMKGSPTSQPAK